MLGGTRGAYTIGGTAISLVLGTGAGSPAKGDIDGDGVPETNEDELVGLIGRPVMIVAVRLSDGTLAVSSVNEVALG